MNFMRNTCPVTLVRPEEDGALRGIIKIADFKLARLLLRDPGVKSAIIAQSSEGKLNLDGFILLQGALE